MSAPSSHSRRITFPKDRLTIGLLIGFGVIAIITAFVAYGYVRGLVSTWNLTNLPGVPLPTDSGSGNIVLTPGTTPQATAPSGPLQQASGPTPQPWDGVSRINILIMGLDYDWAVGGSNAQRTDTMILFTLDPLSKTAGMLSIPRDMWVNIPGFDYGKINTAYSLGQLNNLPGGGPGLAVKTVENLLGVNINYYAQIDFQAFIKFIDDIKGVKVTVPYDMTLGLQGKDQKTYLKQGETVTLDGATALAYARDRHDGPDGDISRSDNQMQVIMAVRDRILQFNMLPSLITNSPTIYNDLSSGIHTNLNLQQIIELALLAAQIPKENIKQEVIGYQEVQDAMSPDGLSILIPYPDKIRILRDELFTTGGPVSPAAVSGDPRELMAEEQATVSIQNASSTPGLAARTGDYLKTQGMNVVDESNAQLSTYTIIYDYTGKPYTIAYLAKLMNVPDTHIYSKSDPNAPADVVVQLGSDWAKSNTLP
jgi:LCP family protein required for cell wall assembly